MDRIVSSLARRKAASGKERIARPKARRKAAAPPGTGGEVRGGRDFMMGSLTYTLFFL